jgi:hypothetical protein
VIAGLAAAGALAWGGLGLAPATLLLGVLTVIRLQRRARTGLGADTSPGKPCWPSRRSRRDDHTAMHRSRAAALSSTVPLARRAVRAADRPRGPRVGELAAQALAADGITIYTGRTVTRAQPTTGGGAVITLDDVAKVEADVVILGAGRRPHTGGLGLDSAGLQPAPDGAIPVDEHCQAGPGLWALPHRAGAAPPVGIGLRRQSRKAPDRATLVSPRR